MNLKSTILAALSAIAASSAIASTPILFTPDKSSFTFNAGSEIGISFDQTYTFDLASGSTFWFETSWTGPAVSDPAAFMFGTLYQDGEIIAGWSRPEDGWRTVEGGSYAFRLEGTGTYRLVLSVPEPSQSGLLLAGLGSLGLLAARNRQARPRLSTLDTMASN